LKELLEVPRKLIKNRWQHLPRDFKEDLMQEMTFHLWKMLLERKIRIGSPMGMEKFIAKHMRVKLRTFFKHAEYAMRKHLIDSNIVSFVMDDLYTMELQTDRWTEFVIDARTVN